MPDFEDLDTRKDRVLSQVQHRSNPHKFDTVAFKLGVMIDDGYFIFSTLAFFSFGSRSQSLICLKVAVNVSSSGKPVLRYMYYVNEPGLTLLMKKTHSSTPILSS